MPVHDWTRVDAGIFHAMHQGWITSLSNALNAGLLPEDYYALPEQFAGGVGPDVLTLHAPSAPNDDGGDGPAAGKSGKGSRVGLLIEKPKLALTAETDLEFYRRKQDSVVVRHVSGDRVVAVIEIVSPGNKANRKGMNGFLEKVGSLLDRGVHFLIVDVLPPGRRDPNGIHGAIWDEVAGGDYCLPSKTPLTLASYESDVAVRAYVQHIAVGDCLIDMPLFLEPGAHVPIPLEATYAKVFAEMPKRWRRVIEG